jgi:hypothetical protein
LDTTPAFQTEAFGRYFLVDRIAVGGMAEVFKAKSFAQGGFEKLLVIKRILQHLSGNEEFIEMFVDEAKISVELQHPNIVQIYDFGKLGQNYYIAMECVEGKDVKGLLRKLSEKRRSLPPEYAVYIAYEACRGLDFAHKKANSRGEPLNIVHRDISPSNILLSYTGDIKIADFGIAKAQISLYNTKDGVLKGKFEYMSPEQASGGRVTPKSDIFALGIILHEMLTGRRLFKTDSELKTLEKVKAVDVQPPSAVNPSVSQALDELVMRALNKDPEARFADAREFQGALLEVMSPTSPDVLRESLHAFLSDVFAEEIAEERARLEHGTRRATEMWEAEPELPLDEEWGTGTRSLVTQPASRWPWMLAGLLAMGLLAAVGVVGWLVTRPEPAPEVVTQEPAPASTGILAISITPADLTVKVSIGGGAATERKGSFREEGLQPNPSLSVKVEAEGYHPIDEVVELGAGETVKLPLRMVVLTEEKPEPGKVEPAVVEPSSTGEKPPEDKPEEAKGKPIARFSSKPGGARVLVNGVEVGETPMLWDVPEGSSSVQVEYRLDGYEPMSFKAKMPEAGTEPFSRNLKAIAVAAAPGKVNVVVKGGWGNVFVDGKSTGRQTPTRLDLSPGKHTIRVTNPESGLDQSKEVEVVSGETKGLSF